jgi:hypothetical protein
VKKLARYVVLATAFAGMLVYGGAALADPGPNLAPDPDFESPVGTSYSTDGPCAFSQATDQSASPTHSLKIVSTQAGTCRWMSAGDAIAVGSARFLAASARLKTEAVDHGSAWLTVTFWTAGGSYVSGSSVDSGSVAGTQDWAAVSLLAPVPAGAAFMRLEFRLAGPGTLWIDDPAVEAKTREIFNTSPPVLTWSGLPTAGFTVTTTLGEWSDSPDSFAVNFLRCDAQACRPIPGAGGLIPNTYTLTNDDVGFSIKAQVFAMNADDPGASATSNAIFVRPPCQVFSDFCNVAPNPSFESSPEPDYTTAGTARFIWADDESRTGTHSLEIDSAGGGLSRWMSRPLPVNQDVFFVSAYLKTAQVDHGYAALTLTYWTAAGTYISGSAADAPTTLTGGNDWTQLLVPVSPPPGAAFVRVEFRLYGPGKLWIDDLDIEQLFGV